MSHRSVVTSAALATLVGGLWSASACLVSFDENLLLKDAGSDGRTAADSDSVRDTAPPAPDAALLPDGPGDAPADQPIGGDGPACDPQWWSCDWQFRRELRLDNASQTEALTDFPVLVVLDSARFAYDRAQSGGQDIRFIDADHATVLPHEIESWQQGARSFVWVKVPRIDGSSSSDRIWIYYGNPDVADGQDPPAVWSAGYAGVWHLSQDPAAAGTPIADSTGGGNDGTPSGAMTSGAQVAGQVNGSLDFNGTDDSVEVDDPGSGSVLDFAAGAKITLSAWLSPDALTGQMIPLAKPSEGGTANYMIEIVGEKVTFALTDAAQGWHIFESAVDPLVAGAATHLTVCHTFGSASATRLHIDGEPVAGAWVYGSGDASPSVSDDALQIGAYGVGNKPFDGWIDEVRISRVARSADWIAAQHKSMTDTFISYGAEQPQP